MLLLLSFQPGPWLTERRRLSTDKIADPGRVCLGGNDAPGVGANYLVLVGPMVDLSLAPSHRVEIRNLQTHSTSPTPPRVSQMGVGDTYYTDEQYLLRAISMSTYPHSF